MSLPQEVASSYQALVESGNIRYVTVPGAAVGIQAVSDGAAAAWAWAAYVEIVAAGIITDPSWLCGISYHTGIGPCYGELGIASGALAAEVDLAIIPFVIDIPTAVGIAVALPSWLPYPIKLTGSPRLSVTIRKDTGAGVEGGTLTLILGEAIGA